MQVWMVSLLDVSLLPVRVRGSPLSLKQPRLPGTHACTYTLWHAKRTCFLIHSLHTDCLWCTLCAHLLALAHTACILLVFVIHVSRACGKDTRIRLWCTSHAYLLALVHAICILALSVTGHTHTEPWQSPQTFSHNRHATCILALSDTMHALNGCLPARCPTHSSERFRGAPGSCDRKTAPAVHLIPLTQRRERLCYRVISISIIGGTVPLDVAAVMDEWVTRADVAAEGNDCTAGPRVT